MLIAIIVFIISYAILEHKRAKRAKAQEAFYIGLDEAFAEEDQRQPPERDVTPYAS